MPALTPNSLIDLVAAKLAAVSGIGVIHKRRRKVQTEVDARSIWYSDAQSRIHAWHISLTDGPTVNSTRHPGFGAVGSGIAGTVLSDFGIVLEGVFGIDDAADSETTFRAIAWDVVMAFNREGKIDNAITQQGPTLWERWGYQVLASMYEVHYARLSTRYIAQVLP